MTDEFWRTVLGAGAYEVSNLGRVRNAKTLRVLKPNMSTGSPSVALRVGSETVRRGVGRLMRTAFDDVEPTEKWRVCKEAYQYSVSNLGRVQNNKTGRILKTCKNAQGVTQVSLYDAGWHITRSVARLVKEAFEP